MPRPLFSMGATSIPCFESSVTERQEPMVSSSALMISALGFLSLRRMGKYSVTLWLAVAAACSFPALVVAAGCWGPGDAAEMVVAFLGREYELVIN